MWHESNVQQWVQRTNADLSPVLNLNMSPAVLAGNSHFIYLFPLFWNYSGSPDMKNVIESMAHGPTCGRRFNENIAFLLRIRVKTLLCFKLRPRTGRETLQHRRRIFGCRGLNSKLNQHAEGGEKKINKKIKFNEEEPRTPGGAGWRLTFSSIKRRKEEKKKKDSHAALRHNYSAGVRLGYENANERNADVI